MYHLDQKPALLERHSNIDKSKKDMTKTIDINFSGEENVFYEAKDNLRKTILISLIILMFSFFSSVIIRSWGPKLPIFRVFSVLLEVASYFICSYLLTTVLTFILSKAPTWGIEYLVLKSTRKLISASLGLYICVYIINRTFPYIMFITTGLDNLNPIEKEVYNTLYSYGVIACTILSPIFLIITIRTVILKYINYRIQYKFLKKRVLENDRLTSTIHKLNKYTRQDSPSEISTWARHMFDCITKGQNETILIGDFTSIYGEQEGNSLFELFDINKNGQIDQDEFVEIYVSIFQERQTLKKSLEENTKGLNKLGTLITIALVMFFLCVLLLYGTSTHNKSFYILCLIIICSLYITSGLLTEVINSIIYIFLVHPFDINDKIEINDTTYTVKSIGILYTDVERHGEVLTLPNVSLIKRDIKNFRNVEYVIFNLRRQIPTSLLKTIPDYKKRIKSYLSDNRTKFKTDFKVTNLEISDAVTVFDVVIKVCSTFQESESVMKRRDEMVIFLHRLEGTLFK
ncbi:Mechanosensitive ion channel protein 10 [Cucumispora dikerogammari]|nr:Mechanosensitive ion channel protein 10 [Cucumispora dikerogammari]